MDQRLKLMWHCEDKIFNVGELINRDNRYYFNYIGFEVEEAVKCGFEPLKGFPRIGSKYYSEQPFRLFLEWAGKDSDDEDSGFDTFRGLSHDSFSFESAE